MDGLEFRILGPLEVWRDGRQVPVTADRQRAVLVTLLLHLNRVVSTDHLVALVWGDQPPVTARNTLQTLVSRLRRLLSPDDDAGTGQPLLTRPPGYLLELEPERLDMCRFAELVRRGREALASGHARPASQLLAEAMGLWRGPALADVSAAELRRTEGARLAEWYLQAVEDRLEADLGQGRFVESIGELRRLVAEHPLRERPYGQLMRALYQSGRQAEALDTYRALRMVLVEQLGIEPGPEVQLLHQTILRGNGEPTLAAALGGAAERTVPRQLPPDVTIFTGRGAEMARLDEALAEFRPPTAVPAVAVVGLPGVGKTALTVHWAHQICGRFPDGQLYVDLLGYATVPPLEPAEVLAQFLRALGVPAEAVPVTVSEAVAQFRSLLADRRVLVVLDNARDADQIRPLLPAGPDCMVLVTSRDRLDGLAAHEYAHRLTLDPLPPAEAHALLARGIGDHRAGQEPEALAALARQCGYLPLALRLAAAHLAGRQERVADYLSRLAAEGPLTELAVAGDEQGAVRNAFALSYAALPGDAARLFQLLGSCLGSDIPVAAAAAVADVPPATATRLLDRLAAAHVMIERAPGRYAFHDVLRHYAAELAGEVPLDVRVAARDRLFHWYLVTADAAARLLHPGRLRLPGPDRTAHPEPAVADWEDPVQALAWLDVERDNLVAVVKIAAVAGPRPVAWLLADALRGYLSQGGHLVEWDTVGRAALAAAETEGDLTARAASRLVLAELQVRRGRYPAAIDLYQQAIEFCGQAGWLAGTAGAYNSLGAIDSLVGHTDSALEHYGRALEMFRQLGWVQGQASILQNRGATSLQAGRPEEAAGFFAEALELYRGLGPHPGLAAAHCGVGEGQLALGRLEPARAHLTEALTRYRLNGNRGEEAEALRLLAELDCAAGRLEPARSQAAVAVDLARDAGEPQIEAQALLARAIVEEVAGEAEQAAATYREALRRARDATLPYCETQAHLGLAGCYHRLGKPGPAAAHAGQALTTARASGYRALEDRAVTLLAELPPVEARPVR